MTLYQVVWLICWKKCFRKPFLAVFTGYLSTPVCFKLMLTISGARSITTPNLVEIGSVV